MYELRSSPNKNAGQIEDRRQTELFVCCVKTPPHQCCCCNRRCLDFLLSSFITFTTSNHECRNRSSSQGRGYGRCRGMKLSNARVSLIAAPSETRTHSFSPYRVTATVRQTKGECSSIRNQEMECRRHVVLGYLRRYGKSVNLPVDVKSRCVTHTSTCSITNIIVRHLSKLAQRTVH